VILLKSIRILVVEDDLFSFKLIKKYLSKDHQIIGNAVSTDQAVELFEKTVPDLVIMDIKLEGSLDGIHASEMINEIRTVPIIYITGTDPENTRLLKKRIIRSHPYAFLRKPLNFEELKMIIELSYEKFLTENKLIELNDQLIRLTREAEKYQFLIQSALEDGNILIWEYNLSNGQYMVSGNWLKQLAVNRDNGLTQMLDFKKWQENVFLPDSIRAEKELRNFLENGEIGFETEYRILTNDSHYIWILTKGKVFESRKGTPVKLIGTHLNISARKAAEKKIETYAAQDSLTKTLNRKMGMQSLSHQILKARKGKIPFTAAYLDIDGLKHVNDTFGHKMGDELILQMVNVFRSCLRETDIISRLGGDEFLLLFPNCGYENAEKIMNRINSEFSNQNLDGMFPFFMSGSYGMTEYDVSSSLSAEEFLSQLDQLMYEQKKNKEYHRN